MDKNYYAKTLKDKINALNWKSEFQFPSTI